MPVQDHSPSIIPDHDNPLLEIIAHLGAALIQADFTDDQIIIGHVRSAHRLALDLRGESVRSGIRQEGFNAPF